MNRLLSWIVCQLLWNRTVKITNRANIEIIIFEVVTLLCEVLTTFSSGPALVTVLYWVAYWTCMHVHYITQIKLNQNIKSNRTVHINEWNNKKMLAALKAVGQNKNKWVNHDYTTLASNVLYRPWSKHEWYRLQPRAENCTRQVYSTDFNHAR